MFILLLFNLATRAIPVFQLKSKGTLEDEMVARIPFWRSGANYLKLRENKFEWSLAQSSISYLFTNSRNWLLPSSLSMIPQCTFILTTFPQCKKGGILGFHTGDRQIGLKYNEYSLRVKKITCLNNSTDKSKVIQKTKLLFLLQCHNP